MLKHIQHYHCQKIYYYVVIKFNEIYMEKYAWVFFIKIESRHYPNYRVKIQMDSNSLT